MDGCDFAFSGGFVSSDGARHKCGSVMARRGCNPPTRPDADSWRRRSEFPARGIPASLSFACAKLYCLIRRDRRQFAVVRIRYRRGNGRGRVVQFARNQGSRATPASYPLRPQRDLLDVGDFAARLWTWLRPLASNARLHGKSTL